MQRKVLVAKVATAVAQHNQRSTTRRVSYLVSPLVTRLAHLPTCTGFTNVRFQQRDYC